MSDTEVPMPDWASDRSADFDIATSRPLGPEPQGEPTEALGRFSFDGAEGIAFWVGDSDEESTVKVMFSELMDLAKFLCDNFPGLFKAESDGAHLKAEPTDAQVEAEKDGAGQ